MYVANSGRPFDSARSTPHIHRHRRPLIRAGKENHGRRNRTRDVRRVGKGADAVEQRTPLAELSGIGESTLAEWRGTHTGPAYVKSGRRVLYPKEAVLGFMRANLRECKEASA